MIFDPIRPYLTQYGLIWPQLDESDERYFPMVRLVYESLADYLVRKRNYDGLLLDDFTTDEMQLLSRHQIVDFDNLNVKLSF